MMELPSGDYVYIIGAQKAATSTLHTLLARHPDIYFYPQEAAFFDKANWSDSESTRQQFAAYFAGRTSERILGLKRPNWLHHPDVPARVHSFTPDARFIAILRAPVSRLVSAYYHYVRNSHLPVAHINDGLPRLLDGDWAEQYPRIRGELVDYGFYAAQLVRWQRLFDRDRFLIFLLRDIKHDITGVLRTCCHFLGVNEHADFGNLQRREKESVYSLHRLKVLQLASFKQMGQFDPAKMSDDDRLFRQTIRQFDRTTLKKLFPAGKPQLSPDLTDRLRALYQDDSSRLAGMLDRDLSHWSVFG